MGLEDKQPQTSGQLELPFACRGEASTRIGSEEASTAAHETERSGTSDLLERVCERSNLQAALKRVKKNKGSAGIDAMTVDELPEHLRTHWEAIRARILGGTYQPSAVRRVAIPKSNGGVRELGIPTVLDRFVQQAIAQVLGRLFDPTFSGHSYGFRPRRSQHDAVKRALGYVNEGRRIVVDVDLEAFFDRVNHDVLMGKLAKRIDDKRLLGLIRRFLEAGMMANGVVRERDEGTPQGGPLSPLLANVLLDEVDKELEKRGHAFVRYADDCNVYVRSRRAGERVMRLLRGCYAKLKLRVNEAKSAVDQVSKRKLLGFTMRTIAKSKPPTMRVVIAPKAKAAMKDRIRALTRRTGGRSIPSVVAELRTYLVGWKNYFRLSDTPWVFRELDEWIRHRLRAILLAHWKRPRTIYDAIRRRGRSPIEAAKVAANARRWWRNSHGAINAALPIRYFDELGLPRLAT